MRGELGIGSGTYKAIDFTPSSVGIYRATTFDNTVTINNPATKTSSGTHAFRILAPNMEPTSTNAMIIGATTSSAGRLDFHVGDSTTDPVTPGLFRIGTQNYRSAITMPVNANVVNINAPSNYYGVATFNNNVVVNGTTTLAFTKIQNATGTAGQKLLQVFIPNLASSAKTVVQVGVSDSNRKTVEFGFMNNTDPALCYGFLGLWGYTDLIKWYGDKVEITKPLVCSSSLTLPSGNVETLIASKANSTHTHSEYALTNHTHNLTSSSDIKSEGTGYSNSLIEKITKRHYL
jgi:hypothetical protein